MERQGFGKWGVASGEQEVAGGKYEYGMTNERPFNFTLSILHFHCQLSILNFVLRLWSLVLRQFSFPSVVGRQWSVVVP